MASAWTPPANGVPCWVNIYALDVQRAKEFYSTVFHWNFRNESVHEGASYTPDQVAKFHFPGLGLGGGITRLEEAEFISSKGKGGASLYLYVDDLEGYAQASIVPSNSSQNLILTLQQRIITAGGSRLSEPIPESTDGVMQHFEDTEGNFFGLYSWRKTTQVTATASGAAGK